MALLKLSGKEFCVFLLTFFSIVATHTAREGWWMVKAQVHYDMEFSASFLGALDFTFLFLYSFGYFVSGVVASRFCLVKVMTSGMVMAMFALWAVALCGVLRVQEKWVYLLLWCIEGPVQGVILTTGVSILGNWVPFYIRGQVMGAWGANSSVGNILGQWVAAITNQDLDLPWEGVIVSTSSLLGIVAVFIFVFIEPSPSRNSLSENLIEKETTEVGFWESWKLPGVTECAVCYGCIKMLNYGFFMWLPFYLKVVFGMQMTQISILATLYDLGGVLGSIVSGYISDLTMKRSTVVECMMICSVPLLLAFQVVGLESSYLFFGLVPITGYMIGGSANIISVAVASDLAKDISTKPKPTIIGIINGTGAFGAAIGQVLIGYIQSFSWNAVFGFMMLVSILSCCFLVRIVYREVKSTNLQTSKI